MLTVISTCCTGECPHPSLPRLRGRVREGVRPHVARPIDDVARRIVDRWQAFEHLLIGGRVDDRAVGAGVRLRRAAPIVDHALDGRAVELLQRAELTRAGALVRTNLARPEVLGSLPRLGLARLS